MRSLSLRTVCIHRSSNLTVGEPFPETALVAVLTISVLQFGPPISSFRQLPLTVVLPPQVSFFDFFSSILLHSNTHNPTILPRNELFQEIFFPKELTVSRDAFVDVSGYVGLAAISTATIPSIFPPLKWYLILFLYIIAPALAFGNSYASGLTNWTVASTYGKISIFIVASFVGSDGGVIAGLASCGVIFSIVNTASDLMQDFKTGYLTQSSAKSMFVSQLIGTAMGCIISPLTFWMFWTAFDVGSPDGQFKAPFGVIYREMAILGVEGFSKLPKHCLALCCGFFVAALFINLLRDLTPANFARFIPIPMAMGLTFYMGAYLAIDMFVGTVILFVWERMNRKDAEDYAGAVASGLICGDGIWTVPSAILSIFRVDPPICMYFRPSLSR
ncbi:YELLOW STRIPE like 6 [Actinidia rufa]|uniref:YELLOW STRIPE like 6 n=1 Tax=Actinidia rufa TaxID=165716 RepID=A0A7J0E9L8_9ERIC|nr:YELLOW STRIPE like 6 [Actinidia rufa]